MKKSVYSSGKKITCKDTGEVVTGDKYLSSKHWKNFRHDVYTKYNGICQECGFHLPESDFHVHHVSYKNIGKEQYKDVRLLCADCHNKIHTKEKRHRNMTAVDINLKAYIDCMNINQKKDLIRYIERKHYR